MFIQIILILLLIITNYHFLFRFKFYEKESKKKIQNNYIDRHNLNIFNRYSFEFIGNLYNKEKNIMLKLYGRERIRHVWDYFIIYNNHSTETKIDLENTKKRLEHLDSLFIEIFQAEFILYKNENKYKYYPYIFSA